MYHCGYKLQPKIAVPCMMKSPGRQRCWSMRMAFLLAAVQCQGFLVRHHPFPPLGASSIISTSTQPRRPHKQPYPLPSPIFAVAVLAVATRDRSSSSSSNDNNNDRIITFANFWIATKAHWTQCETPLTPPTFTSKSNSSYHDVGHGIVRTSDHWTGQHGVYNIVDCHWTLDVPHEKGQVVSAYTPYEGIRKVVTKGRKTLRQRGITLEKRTEKVVLVKIPIDFTNFWRSTVAKFTACETPDREPDYRSKSGSAYWDDGDAVIRSSDHWSGQHGITRIVDCHWTIDQPFPRDQAVSARCMYDDFVKKKKKDGSKKVGWRKIGR